MSTAEVVVAAGGEAEGGAAAPAPGEGETGSARAAAGAGTRRFPPRTSAKREKVVTLKFEDIVEGATLKGKVVRGTPAARRRGWFAVFVMFK